MIFFHCIIYPLEAIVEILEQNLTCVSKIEAISLNKPLLSLLQTPGPILLGFGVLRQMNPISLVTQLLWLK